MTIITKEEDTKTIKTQCKKHVEFNKGDKHFSWMKDLLDGKKKNYDDKRRHCNNWNKMRKTRRI